MKRTPKSSHWNPFAFLPHTLRRIYDWVLSLAQTRHASTSLFLVAFAESSFFPIPPDVLLVAMGVGQPKKSLRFATVCLVGSILGGIVGYFIGLGLWSMVDQFFFTYVPNFTPALFDKVSGLYKEHAFWAVFTAGFTPIPYKIFTISAGVAQIHLPAFIFASVISRGLRFYLVGGLLWYFGPRVQKTIDKYFNLLTIVFTVLLLGGFVVLKQLTH